jgi:hypothetical protein
VAARPLLFCFVGRNYVVHNVNASSEAADIARIFAAFLDDGIGDRIVPVTRYYQC